MGRQPTRDRSEWTAVSVLPNVELETSIDGNLAALTPCEDARVLSLTNAYLNLREFLARFSDAFGVRLNPSVLLVRSDAPQRFFTVGAIASFRDAIALSVVPYNRAAELVYPRGHRISFSHSFWLYPWMVDRNNEYLIANTPALLALHEVSEFHGQSSPEMSHMRLGQSDVDQPLLRLLLSRWQRCYGTSRPLWPDIALFRSLNMAYQASQLPAGADTTFYDVGRLIALWVSAFEILAHPGEGRSGLFAVYDLLDRVAWEHQRSKVRRYAAYEANRRTAGRRRIANRIYGEIYQARNDFLHGNPVSPRRLTIRSSGRSLFNYAAPLYRLALTGFLPLSWNRPSPPMENSEEVGRYLAEHMEFVEPQRLIERALHTMFVRPEDASPDNRRRRLRSAT